MQKETGKFSPELCEKQVEDYFMKSALPSLE